MQPHAVVPPTTSDPQNTIISKEDITELSQQISELSTVSLTDDRRHVEDIRQRLDRILLTCWIKLNLPVEEMELVTGIPGTF
jgi:cell pole-organizing protein PopZ